jgi:sigma54-dependent transcription regulator
VTRTLTLDHDASTNERAIVHGPHVVLALEASRPCERPARFSLAGLDEVVIGRGSRRRRVREGAQLRIEIPDGFLSSRHLCLVREGDAWVAEDAGSKNGTRLRGARLTRASLEDDDLLVAGSSLFLFRGALAAFAGEQDVDLGGIRLGDAPLATLNAELAHQLSRLVRVAKSRVPMLVRGETGVGKELVARAIHEHGERRGPFVAINCGSLPSSLVAAELFGSRKGAFTGAAESRRGLVRSADGGTLFLDEIAELPLDAQAMLLRVLQEGEVLPLGSDQPVSVDVKIVAATHRDLEELVREGAFREDLLGRIAGYELELPPLRARREDLGLVIGSVLMRGGSDRASFTAEAAAALFEHTWPRNVRELEHALTAALAVSGQGTVALDHLPESVRRAQSFVAGTSDERARLLSLLARHDGNVSAVARALATSRSQVRRLAQRLDIDLTTFRAP